MTSDESAPVENEALENKIETDETATAGNEALVRKVEALEKEVVGVNTALARGRNTTRLLLLGVLVFLACFGWLFYQMFMDFKSEENIKHFTEVAQQELENSSGTYSTQVKQLVDHARPILTDAFIAQAKKDVPKLTAAATRERDILIKNLRSRLTAQVKSHYEEAVKQHQAILKEEFAQIDDPQKLERMTVNMQSAFDKMLEKYYADQLSTELQRMFDTWDEFPMANQVAEGQPALEDELVSELLQLLTVKLADKRTVSTIIP